MRRAIALIAVATAFAGCGGGGETGDAAAATLADRLLGSEMTDDTRNAHECVTRAVTEAFDTEVLETLAGAPDLEALDVPSRRRLLDAALSCVSATELGG